MIAMSFSMEKQGRRPVKNFVNMLFIGYPTSISAHLNCTADTIKYNIYPYRRDCKVLLLPYNDGLLELNIKRLCPGN